MVTTLSPASTDVLNVWDIGLHGLLKELYSSRSPCYHITSALHVTIGGPTGRHDGVNMISVHTVRGVHV